MSARVMVAAGEAAVVAVVLGAGAGAGALLETGWDDAVMGVGVGTGADGGGDAAAGVGASGASGAAPAGIVDLPDLSCGEGVFCMVGLLVVDPSQQDRKP